MRTILTILGFVVSGLLIKANSDYEYHSILEIDKEWTVEYYFDSASDSEDYMVYFKVIDKTIFNGEECFIIERRDEREDEIISRLFMKESNRQLFYWSDYYNFWQPVLDFNCQEGDLTISPMPGSSQPWWYVVESGFWNFSGITRRYIKVGSVTTGSYWIEGIGAPDLQTLVPIEIPSCIPPIIIPKNRIIECKLNNIVLFDINEFIKYSHTVHPTIDISDTNDGNVYELNGLKTRGFSSSGIIIKNGKKYILNKQ